MLASTGRASRVVGPSETAAAVGSGDLPVLATPVMIALMEAAACEALAGRLQEGSTSVGIRIDVRHLAPTPVGATVTAIAEVVDVQGATVTFSVSASQDTGHGPVEIGSGTHVRAVVDRERFLARI